MYNLREAILNSIENILVSNNDDTYGFRHIDVIKQKMVFGNSTLPKYVFKKFKIQARFLSDFELFSVYSDLSNMKIEELENKFDEMIDRINYYD